MGGRRKKIEKEWMPYTKYILKNTTRGGPGLMRRVSGQKTAYKRKPNLQGTGRGVRIEDKGKRNQGVASGLF